MKALVIDDSRAIRALIGRTLVSLGLDVVEAEHGQAGLDRLKEHPDVAIALVDWNMPVMDGLEFVRVVRKQDETARLPILMVTTETEISQMVRALAAGASEYLMKPFTDDALADKLHVLGIKAA